MFRYQDYPPEKFEAKLERALSQPIAVTSRERVDNDDYPVETFDMTGSDEIQQYKVEIKLVPNCSCGDFAFRYLFALDNLTEVANCKIGGRAASTSSM